MTTADGWTIHDPPIELDGTGYMDVAPREHAGLVSPGMLLKVIEDGKAKVYLVGDVNPDGGVCDCCRVLGGTTLVASKRIWEPAP